jgi:hypothetical protein
MPTVRKLTPDEVQALQNKGKAQRRLTEEQYDAFLSEFAADDYGEVELDEDEKRLTVRNRLKAAARRRSLGIDFKRTQGDIIRFKLTAVDQGNGQDVPPVVPEVVSSEPPPAPKRKGGRPRKTT